MTLRSGSALSGSALAASLALLIAAPMRGPASHDELVASRVRSLLLDHLTDVAMSDQVLPGPP